MLTHFVAARAYMPPLIQGRAFDSSLAEKGSGGGNKGDRGSDGFGGDDGGNSGSGDPAPFSFLDPTLTLTRP